MDINGMGFTGWMPNLILRKI